MFANQLDSFEVHMCMFKVERRTSLTIRMSHDLRIVLTEAYSGRLVPYCRAGKGCAQLRLSSHTHSSDRMIISSAPLAHTLSKVATPPPACAFFECILALHGHICTGAVGPLRQPHQNCFSSSPAARSRSGSLRRQAHSSPAAAARYTSGHVQTPPPLSLNGGSTVVSYMYSLYSCRE